MIFGKRHLTGFEHDIVSSVLRYLTSIGGAGDHLELLVKASRLLLFLSTSICDFSISQRNGTAKQTRRHRHKNQF